MQTENILSATLFYTFWFLLNVLLCSLYDFCHVNVVFLVFFFCSATAMNAVVTAILTAIDLSLFTRNNHFLFQRSQTLKGWMKNVHLIIISIF